MGPTQAGEPANGSVGSVGGVRVGGGSTADVACVASVASVAGNMGASVHAGNNDVAMIALVPTATYEQDVILIDLGQGSHRRRHHDHPMHQRLGHHVGKRV